MKDYSKETDEVLIERFRAGEDEILDYLMERHKDLVLKKSYALFLIGADKEDLIQEGMIGLLKAIREYDSKKSDRFVSFASLCITRQMYTAIEAAGRKKNDPLNSYLSLTAGYGEDGSGEGILNANAGASPEQMYIDQESVRLLRAKIEKALSPLEQKVLALHLEGIGYQEIAVRLGRTPKSIDNALCRLKTKITKVVEED